MKNKFKTINQRGSISIFVLLSALFFLVLVTSVATSSKNMEAKIDAEYKKIKTSYEKDIVNEDTKYAEEMPDNGSKKIKLVVNPNGGIWENSSGRIIYEEEGTEKNLGTPTPPSVKFDLNGGNPLTESPDSISFVKWELNGGGSLNGNTYTFGNEDSTIKAIYNKEAITLPHATRDGYIFNGWYSETKKEGNAGDRYSPKGMVTLTAHWVEKQSNKIILAFRDASGEEKHGTPNPLILYDNESGTVTAPAIASYGDWTAKYWTRSSETNGTKAVNSEGELLNVSESATYYAIYEKNITVAFDKNGGEGENPTSQIGKVMVNSSDLNNITTIQVTIPDVEGLSRVGYNFAGWNTKQDGTGDTYTGNREFNKSTTLYAKWVANSSKLVIDPGDGKVKVKSPESAEEEEITESKEYTQEYNTILKYDTPTKADSTDTSTKYTIKYDTDGGSTAPEDQEATVTKVTGYIFNEWTKSNGFKGTLNETNKTYTFPADKNNTDTITATYTESESSAVEKITLGEAPTKSGYTFTGWKSSTNNQVYNAEAEYEPTGNTTMTAQWELDAITFENKTITKTFSTIAQTVNNGVDVATGGTGTYTYAITAGNENNYFSLSERNLTIAANTPANTSGYEITITATDSGSGATASATYTIKINKKESTTSVKITGTNTDGQTLTADKSTNGDGAVSYQWYHTSISNSNKITNATNSTLLLTSDLVGKKIYVNVTVAEGTNYLGSNADDATDSTNNGTEIVKAKGYIVEYYKGNSKLGESSHGMGQAKNLTSISELNGTLNGYDFYGWTETQNGLTRDYTDSQSVTNLASEGQTKKLYAIYNRDFVVTYYITADNPSTDTETKTQYHNPNGATTSLSVTLPNVTDGKSRHVFDGWNNSSGTKVGNAGDSISVTGNMELTSKWKEISESAISTISVTKSGSQLTFNNIPDDVNVRVWTPTRIKSDKQMNPLYCQRNEPNLVLDSTHNTTQNYISKTSLPSTYTDVYIDIQDKNGNTIYSVRYCDLTSANSGTFAETDYEGELYISAVSLISKNNTNGTPSPTIQANGNIDFDLSFKITTSGSPTYSASYSVTITNDTSQDFEFYYPTYRPTAYCTNKKEYKNDNINYTITDITSGYKILSGESKVVKVNYSFVDPYQQSSANGYIIQIDKEGPVDITDKIQEDTNSRLTATVQDTEGDLTGTNTRTAYTVQVTNEYDVSKTFTLSVKETEKFVLVDANGNENPQFTIPAETENQTFTFYLQKAEGAEYAVSSQRPTIVFTPEGLDSLNIGMVTALVDVNTAVTDVDPPEISNVKLELTNTQGEATVTWDGTDVISGVVEDYYIYLYKQDDTKVEEFSTGNDSTTKTITGLQENETYYVTVFGKDAFKNIPDAATISAANTVYAVKSENVNARWQFNVTIKTTSVTYPNNTPKTVNRGETYRVTFTRSNDTWSKYEATMGGESITPNFPADNATCEMSIENVTGDLVITVASSTGGCLAEGTPILLADGTYKKIEDVKYTDLLRVYNHVTGEMTNIYPIWIENEYTSNKYEKITFSDGTELRFVGPHYLFSVDARKYIDVTNEAECKVGTKVYKVNNDKLEEATITNIEYVDEEVKYYHVVSAIQYNVIANGFIAVDQFAALSNVYGFKENATYSGIYDIISKINQLSYEDCKFAPHYIYKGANLKNAGSIFGKMLDASYFKDYIGERTLEPIKKHGKLYFKMTTSLDDWNSEDNDKYLFEEGSKYQLPKTGAKYFIETSTGTRYKPGDIVTVDYSMHFEAVKNNSTVKNDIKEFLKKLISDKK